MPLMDKKLMKWKQNTQKQNQIIDEGKTSDWNNVAVTDIYYPAAL